MMGCNYEVMMMIIIWLFHWSFVSFLSPPVAPEFSCSAKLQVRAGEGLTCDVRGNPLPSVTWLRDGKMLTPPTHLSREDAGNYTLMALNCIGKANHTVEVEVLHDCAARGVFVCLCFCVCARVRNRFLRCCLTSVSLHRSFLSGCWECHGGSAAPPAHSLAILNDYFIDWMVEWLID